MSWKEIRAALKHQPPTLTEEQARENAAPLTNAVTLLPRPREPVTQGAE